MTSLLKANLTPEWWKEANVYQIYPWSFKDTTGTGTGDLNGITSKLQYLKDLGIDVVWMSPIYASPMKDMGYDISDYRAIHPTLGTMKDWEDLVAKAHQIGLKVVMDLVVNHTSDQHAWFQESVKGGKEGPKRDWYIWREPGKDGKEPFNWGAIFGGSAWELDEASGEYYCHVFDVSQPDLNWENPDVREAVWEVMRFWLDKGCDGFRMDVINCISKIFEDAPVTDPSEKFQFGLVNRFNGPHVIEYLNEMNEKVLDHYPGSFTVGETPGVNVPEKGIKYVQGGRPLQMIFNFEHVFIDVQPGRKCFFMKDWKLTELKDILGTWMTYMQENNGWDSLYLENHDQPRILARYASTRTPTLRLASAKMLAIFHATGRGTLFLYQGQEIGMANSTWTYDDLRDVEEINYYNEEKAKRPEGADMQDCLDAIGRIGRDNARTPVQWSADEGEGAGFSTAPKEKIWIKINPDFREGWNARAQEGVEGSVLEFWRGLLLKVRKADGGALVYGVFEMLDYGNEDVYAYTRTLGEVVYTVVCSFTEREVGWVCPLGEVGEVGELMVGSYGGVMDGEKGGEMKLRPFEGRIYRRTGS
ncbi:hypothetical protein MMC25_005904 [Agyrium rufum]|nr:hypothetical protein [Agyrium rufum]